MKLRGPFFYSIIAVVVLVLGAAIYPKPDTSAKEAILMQTILSGMNQLHYRPQVVNDEFSSRVFDLYVERIDESKRWLLQSDVDQLKSHRLQLDDQALAGNFEFFDLSVDLLQKGINNTKSYYKEILSKPFDFNKDEEIELDGEKKALAKNEAELKEYWRKSLKYETLIRLNNKMEKQEGAKEEDEVEKKTFEELEKEARESVLENFDDWYTQMAKRRRSDFLSVYLNAITNIFDPHSSYYEPADKANFDIGMSGTLEGIGARLQADGDYTKVSSIVVGGPAWKGKDLEENDLIMKVTQGTDTEQAEDITGFRLDDVVKLIRGKKGTKVTLSVKKVDGTLEDVVIVRDVVQLEESYAKSVILNNSEKGVDKIGYIKLPRFYADFNRRGGRSCAKDIEKELEKLTDAGVNGVVLDLRNNGGGSLRDVVRMTGLFIEEGPIVQVKDRVRKPEVLSDHDPRVQYGGPLIVLVNSFSASASEIIAAALQDYDRAIIVGTSSTFGKGTVQRFFDLDQAIRGNSEIKPLGEVKLTIQKFYRVNGGSTQLKGVEPDIVLPDRYHYFEMGERDHDYAMEWTEIPPVVYDQDVVKVDSKTKLKQASKARVASNEVFQKVLANAKRLKEQSDRSSYPLDRNSFDAYQDKIEAESKKYKDMYPVIESLSVSNLEVDKAGIEADESKKARNDEWIKSLKKDIYVDEVLSIMSDMINE